tara:strand:- start:90 stop:335 length:246 start_codon:yes stop_codon:yes gene_type:complete
MTNSLSVAELEAQLATAKEQEQSKKSIASSAWIKQGVDMGFLTGNTSKNRTFLNYSEVLEGAKVDGIICAKGRFGRYLEVI